MTLSLPVCRWRGTPTGEGRHSCHSPKLVVGPRGVPDDKCAACYCRDHEGVPTHAALPCRHLGPETRRERCGTCKGKVELKVFRCAEYGECTPLTPLPGVAGCCAGCPDCSPDTFALVAPLGPGAVPWRWTGLARRKPWHHRVTCAIPHLDTPEILEAVVALHRLQTERPYILVVDTGSPPAVCERLERMRAEDMEIHFVRSHGYLHSSGPVSAAMDLAFALCRTPLLLSTHADVFPVRRDAVAWLTGQCSEECPVVGWEQSPRNGTDGWRGAVSHTFTAWHMPTMRRIGATWAFERYYEAVGLPSLPTIGFPDTEQPINLCLAAAGIKPKLLGPEINFQRQKTEWWDHARSLPGLKVYAAGSDGHRRAEAYGAEALREARARAAAWQASRPEPGGR